MIEITNTGAEPVRVAGQYLQPGASLLVAEDAAIRLMAANPAVVVAGSEPPNTGTQGDGSQGGEAKPTEDKPTEDLPAFGGVTMTAPAERSAVMAFAVAGSEPTTDATKRKK